MACLVRRVENLIVENGEVKGKTQADGVGGSKVSLSDFSGILVGGQRVVGRSLALLTEGELGEITVVVTLPVSEWLVSFFFRFLMLYVEGVGDQKDTYEILHLVIEDLGLSSLGGGNEMVIENLEDIFADIGQLSLDLLTVLLDEGDLSLVSFRLFLLLNGSNDSPGGTSGTDDVLVGNRQQVALLYR